MSSHYIFTIFSLSIFIYGFQTTAAFSNVGLMNWIIPSYIVPLSVYTKATLMVFLAHGVRMQCKCVTMGVSHLQCKYVSTHTAGIVFYRYILQYKKNNNNNNSLACHSYKRKAEKDSKWKISNPNYSPIMYKIVLLMLLNCGILINLLLPLNMFLHVSEVVLRTMNTFMYLIMSHTFIWIWLVLKYF